MAAAHAGAGRRIQRDENFAAPAFHPAEARAGLRRVGESHAYFAARQPREDLALQPQGLERFLETHHDARRDVAVAMRADARLELIVGREPGVDARVDREPARARRDSD